MNWQTVKLGEVCKIVSGSTPKTGTPEYWDGDILWATPKDLSRLNQMYLSDTEKKITEAGLKSCSAQMLPVGSVLFSSRAPIGHVAINTKPVCTNQGFKSFVIDEARLNNRFLYYWLDAKRDYLQSLGNGATFKEVSKAIVSQVEIPLPPLAEQERIAARLDAADRLRALRRDALARLDALTHSLFLEMFGDPARNPMDWPLVKLADACLEGGKYGSGASAIGFVEGAPRYVRITDIEDSGRLKSAKMSAQGLTEKDLKTYKLKAGDVLFARSGATVGKTYNYQESDGDCVYAGYLIRFRPDPNKLTASFLFAFTGTSHYANWVASKQRVVAQPNINAKQYGYDLEIPLPPLSLQQRFAERLGQIERVRADMERSRLELDALFASLQSAAFENAM